MIHVVHWDSASGRAISGDSDALPKSHDELTGDVAVWIDLENPTPEEEDRVFRTFLAVHPLTLEDVTKPHRTPGEGAHLPKVEEFPDYLFVVVNPLPPNMAVSGKLAGNGDMLADPPAPPLGKRTRPQLSAVLTHHALITHHYDSLRVVADVRAYSSRHAESIRRGPDYLFHLVLDAMVDEYAPMVERIADRLDALEEQLFRRPTPAVLARLLRLKREVSFLRKTLILEREVLARLIRGEFALVDPREIVYYRNVYDHLVRYAELTESAREMVSDLMQSHLSAASNRLNEVMKVLTMISTVVLPMSLIAGVYGMNFENTPEFRWSYGFWYAVGLMVMTAAGAVGLFRWKRWL